MPEKIINSCHELGNVLESEKATSVLVVTDKGIIQNGLLIHITDVLNANQIPYAIYSKTLPNPTVDNVEDALKLYYKHCCNCCNNFFCHY